MLALPPTADANPLPLSSILSRAAYVVFSNTLCVFVSVSSCLSLYRVYTIYTTTNIINIISSIIYAKNIYGIYTQMHQADYCGYLLYDTINVDVIAPLSSEMNIMGGSVACRAM